jgi:hypothetical protein
MHKQRDGFVKGKFEKLPMSWRKREVLYKENVLTNEYAFNLRQRNAIEKRVYTNFPFTYERMGGNTLKIKFKNFDVKEQTSKAGKPFKMVHVNGTAIGGKLDGQDYTCKFFGSNKELRGQVEALQPGDLVDIEMKKNGNFWNPVGFKSEGPAPSSNAALMGVPSGVNQRFENLKVAVEILGAVPSDQEPFEYLQDAAGVADMIQDYIDEKGAFQFANTTDEIPGDDEED